MKYKRLATEMLSNDISKKDFAELLEISIDDINDKINGPSDFLIGEVVLIMDTYFKDKHIEDVFG